MKRFIVCLLGWGLFVSLSLSSFAGTAELEKSPWALATDTAYTLDQGKWRISALGWIAYGVSDFFQVGSNFWIDVLQKANVNLKLRLLKESENLPEISTVWSYYYNLSTSKEELSDVGIYTTKKIYENVTLYAGISRIPTTAFLTNFLKLEVTKNNPLPHLGVSYKLSEISRTFIEIYTGVSKTSSSITFMSSAAGVEWIYWGNTHLKLGGYLPSGNTVKNTTFIPVINLEWIF